MKSSLINYFVDIGLGISFLLVFLTGLLKFPHLLPNLGISYTRLPMITFSTLHDWAGITMGILVFVHLVLHWRWIVIITKKVFKK